MLKKEIIVFDFWQTLADSKIKPSDLFSFIDDKNLITKKVFLRLILDSNIFTSSFNIEDSLTLFFSKFDFKKGNTLNDAILCWKQMSKEAFLKDGVEYLVLKLKREGYKLCLATNIDKYGYENFPKKEFFKNFDYILPSYVVGFTKQDPRYWKVIKNHFKRDLKNMIMVGDSVEDDILPAENFGISTMKIDDNYKLNYSNFITKLNL